MLRATMRRQLTGSVGDWSRSGQQSLQIIFVTWTVIIILTSSSPLCQRNTEFCQGSEWKLTVIWVNTTWLIKYKFLLVKLYIFFIRVGEIISVIEFLKTVSWSVAFRFPSPSSPSEYQLNFNSLKYIYPPSFPENKQYEDDEAGCDEEEKCWWWSGVDLELDQLHSAWDNVDQLGDFVHAHLVLTHRQQSPEVARGQLSWTPRCLVDTHRDLAVSDCWTSFIHQHSVQTMQTVESWQHWFRVSWPHSAQVGWMNQLINLFIFISLIIN